MCYCPPSNSLFLCVVSLPPAGGLAERGDGMTCCTDGFCIFCFVPWRWQNKFAFTPFRCGRGRGEWRLPSAMQQQSSLDAVRSGNDVGLHQNVLSDSKSELAETGCGAGALGAPLFGLSPHCASSRNGYGRHVAVISSLQIVLISAAARNHLVAVPNAHTRGRVRDM